MERLMSFTCTAFFVLLVLATANNAGAQVSVSAVVSDSEITAGEIFQITISVTDETDFYSASAEISYENRLLEFAGVETALLSDGGLVFAGDLDSGRTGVAVTRTSPLYSSSSGSFMVLSFMAKTHAVAGNTEINISDLLIHDSAGELIPAESPTPVNIDIAFSIGYIRLQMPAVNEISEGELFAVEGLLFAAGVTDYEMFTFQIGVSETGDDPAEWDEQVWSDMYFEGVDEDDRMRYSAEIAYMRPPGDWFIAVRASHDDGLFIYGGLAGIWDENTSPCGFLTIVPRTGYRYTIAKWDFDNESLLPSVAVFDNRKASVSLKGASLQNFAAGASGLAANSRGWDDWSGGFGFWMVEISTAGFASLEVSSRQFGSNTGPRNFNLEYSLDGNVWQMVDGGEITVAGDWVSGVADRLPLPQVTEDRESLFLRWIMSSTASIGGGVTGSSGTNRIDDILVTGVNPGPSYINVFPGDANNDGVVNADDVLSLGTWWLSTGPPSVWKSMDFIPRTIEQWIPAAATFADTNGDGVVDHKDLLMIGLHFGKTAGPVQKDSTEPLSALMIDPGEDGNNSHIMVMSESETSLRGVAFSIELAGIPDDMWEIRNVVPEFADDRSGSSLLSFMMPQGDIFEGAFVLKGDGEDLVSRNLAGFELVVNESWNEPFTVMLNRLSVSNSSRSATRVEAGSLVLYETMSAGQIFKNEDPGSALMQIYPNPFSSLTSFAINLLSASRFRIEITCLQGRIISTVFDGFREEGLHEILFDGSLLAPGIYFCRLLIPGKPAEVVKFIRY